jgi:hypothetical protein
MSYALSRLMSAATASYAVYALTEPRHLGRALTGNTADQATYDVVAQTYGARDLAISSVGMFAKSEKAVAAAMVIRVACDVADGLLLAGRTDDEQTRQKVLGVTMGWAALNTLALLRDRRKARLARRP